ncbi:ATP-grasp domain-containing protein [Methylocapsa palsarum]|uniref:Predicted ATP-dependent carboligase, ATP-grasp superfamily n=1 Tax=Methylocapsa palsarum TaxID=1612308 RepID=A0A1I3VSH6_9HYPH|nr:ATP-grasp domain-containing protein [Methylocapsa palsarum]SFJ98364.1 Predicted ATP-dependent carboligase, ATP-grasp superfamily [Methylocapsa palsarum]
MRPPEPGAAILIAASSGRALAAAARRAGYRPLVADFFDDSDTRVIAHATRRVEGDPGSGFESEALFEALNALAEIAAPAGIVYGAGFEDRTGLIAEMSKRWPLLGNTPEVVRRIKDPVELSALCACLQIFHPPIRLDVPEDPENWLAKCAGASGGSHVVSAGIWSTGEMVPGNDDNVYFQRIAEGEPVSVLFCADGRQVQILGTSRQWPSPSPDEPFRFGGGVRPAEISAGLESALTSAAAAIVRLCELRGLNSMDCLVDDDDGFTLLEINPRPGATLDIFDDAAGSLFDAHVDGCLSCLPARPPQVSGAQAAGVAYVRRAIASMPALDWPDWTADRQKPGTRLRLNDPLCTVHARSDDPAGARLLLEGRISLILDAAELYMGKEATF